MNSSLQQVSTVSVAVVRYSTKIAIQSHVVRAVVLITLTLCMTVPEEVIAPTEFLTTDFNPLTGTIKLVLLGFGGVLFVLCPSRRRVSVLFTPFALVMAWALLCWAVSGAGIVALRNLGSSFAGIVILAGLCKATDYIGGIRGMVRCLVLALTLSVCCSVLLGVAGLQTMPFQTRFAWQMEYFHGVGRPALTVAGCVGVLAWVLGRYVTKPTPSLEATVLLLLVIPVLVAERTLMVGIVVMILAAAVMAQNPRWRRRRQQTSAQSRAWHAGRMFLVASAVMTVGLGILCVRTLNQPGRELSGREVVWPIVIDNIVQHPIFGVGPYGDIQLLRFDEHFPQAGSAHSDYLAVAVCYGLPGLLFWIFALVRVGASLKGARAVDLDHESCRNAAVLSLVAFATVMIADNIFREPRGFCLYLLWPSLCLVGCQRVSLARLPVDRSRVSAAPSIQPTNDMQNRLGELVEHS